MITRSLLDFLLNPATILGLLAIVGAGLLMRFVLPPGSGQGRSLWHDTRHDWGDVHVWLAAAMSSLLVVHRALHWPCVRGLGSNWGFGNRGRAQPGGGLRRDLAGAAFLAVVLALVAGFLWVAAWSVVDSERGGRPFRRGRGAAS